MSVREATTAPPPRAPLTARRPATGAQSLALRAGGAALLAGPTVLAFSSGGYFSVARITAAIVAWIAVAYAAVVSPQPLPASWPGRVALGGLALLALWTTLSILWTPLAGPAIDDAERLLLYVGALIAAAALLRGPVVRWVEPVLAAGVMVVVGYGLSERVLPGLVHLVSSRSSEGRLDQPLTYWNATGALAAMGLVLCVRLAGDRSRGDRLRALAAAAVAPLGAGLALSFSRGAILAALAGAAVLLTLAPSRGQLRATIAGTLSALIAGGAASAFRGVRTLEGSLSSREREGAVLLAVLLVLVALGAVFALREARAERRRPPGEAARPWRGRRTAGALVAAGLVALLLLGAAIERSPETSTPRTGPTTARLSSADSNRYAYWKVALRASADDPVHGTGSGSFRAQWLKERTIAESVIDAHSLYLETLSELGVVGFGLLLAFLGGVAASARRAYRRAPWLASGWIAALCVWAVHAGIDWDWEMPALTLVALLLAGAAIAAADDDPPPLGSGDSEAGSRPRRPRAAAALARVALAAAATGAVVVAAVALGSARDAEQAIALVPRNGGRATPAEVARSARLFSDARDHSRDVSLLVREAQLLTYDGRPQAALPLLRRAVAREPDNAEAWAQLAVSARTIDRPLAARALRRLQELAPAPG